MFDVRFRGRRIAPSNAAMRELMQVGMSLEDAKDILENGIPAPRKRRKGTVEMRLRAGKKNHKIDGFVCTCGEIFFDPNQAERVLLLNKLRKQKITSKLGRIRSNLILRLPKDVEEALGFTQGEEVELSIENEELRVKAA